MKRTKFYSKERLKPQDRVRFKLRTGVVWGIVGRSENRMIWVKFDDKQHEVTAVPEINLKKL